VIDVEALLRDTAAELNKLQSTKNVLGDPIERDGATVIPIVSFGFGFGAGGQPGGKTGDGGSTDGGGGIKPVGAIIFDENGPRVEGIKRVAAGLTDVIRDAALLSIEKTTKGKSEGKKNLPTEKWHAEHSDLVAAVVPINVAGLGSFCVGHTSKMSARYETTPQHRYVLKIGMLGGYVPPLTVIVSDRKIPRGEGRKKRDSPRRRKTASQTGFAKRIMPNIPRLLAEFLRQFRPHNLTGIIHFRLTLPADTGLFFRNASSVYLCAASDRA